MARLQSSREVDTYQVKGWSGEAMARAFANWINGCDAAEFQEFADTFCNAEHRTLQQQGWQVLKRCIAAWAVAADKGADRGYDLRNTQTVTECQRIRDLLREPDDDHDRYWVQTALI